MRVRTRNVRFVTSRRAKTPSPFGASRCRVLGKQQRINAMLCTCCGHEVPSRAKFCASCGQPVAQACARCQAGLTPNARFCAECGHAVAQGYPTAAEPGSPSVVADGARAGERRQLTVLFCDLVGSTARAHDLDAEDWRDL